MGRTRRPTRAVAAKKLREAYGFDLPVDLFAFDDFARRYPDVQDALEFRLGGPFEVLRGSAGKDWEPTPTSRFYRDPPEFFTVALGNTDGLHWGYWYDDPARSKPVVVSYHHSDSYELGVDGSTLFEALRAHLEQYYRDAEGFLADEPEEDSYRESMDRYDVLRDALTAAGGPKSRAKGEAYLDALLEKKRPFARKTVADTRNHMGIVVPRGKYRPLTRPERFTTWNYVPKPAEVKRDVTRARELLDEGAPGAALKLGHDLWVYEAFQRESHEMLRLAYDALGRDTLRAWLDRAVAWKRTCGAKK